MFHGKHPAVGDLPAVVHRAAAWAGLSLSDRAAAQLILYHDWLATEAIVAGGLGPAEAPRLWERHIADSLVCGYAWAGTPPRTMADLGSGVGLPGIPLAIVFSTTDVTLIDRSGRRCGLLRRIGRVLDLEVTVVEADVAAVTASRNRFAAVVSRATFPPGDAVGMAASLLEPGGTAIIPLQRGGAPPTLGEPSVATVTTSLVAVPDNVLDATVWLLRMQMRDDHSH
jgi:16S rRNA (guanine527-N7)-methyltransferase